MNMNLNRELSFSANEIRQMLPHKYPFLMVDSAYDIIPGVSGKGRKLYTINEWFFPGHFPEEPIVPGVLLIESLAQLTAVVYLSEAFKKEGGNQINLQELSRKVGYLVKVDVKFLKPARPGCILEMDVSIIKKMGNLSLVNVKAIEGKSFIVEGQLFVSEQKGF
ncbi:MAG: beta-hydroxyacyl-ACP dehydratase [Treponemataceae bacterium]|nr:beta-hydroxyacyl-ACP dehydratase [Treponemataceae bacterium]